MKVFNFFHLLQLLLETLNTVVTSEGYSFPGPNSLRSRRASKPTNLSRSFLVSVSFGLYCNVCSGIISLVHPSK